MKHLIAIAFATLLLAACKKQDEPQPAPEPDAFVQDSSFSLGSGGILQAIQEPDGTIAYRTNNVRYMKRPGQSWRGYRLYFFLNSDQYPYALNAACVATPMYYLNYSGPGTKERAMYADAFIDDVWYNNTTSFTADSILTMPADAQFMRASSFSPSVALSPAFEASTSRGATFLLGALYTSWETLTQGVLLKELSAYKNTGFNDSSAKVIPIFDLNIQRSGQLQGIYHAAGAFFVASPLGLHRVAHNGTHQVVLRPERVFTSSLLDVQGYGNDTVMARFLPNRTSALNGVYLSADGGQSFTTRFSPPDFLAFASLNKVGKYMIAGMNGQLYAFRWGSSVRLVKLPTIGLPYGKIYGVFRQGNTVYVMSELGVYRKPIWSFLQTPKDSLG